MYCCYVELRITGSRDIGRLRFPDQIGSWLYLGFESKGRRRQSRQLRASSSLLTFGSGGARQSSLRTWYLGRVWFSKFYVVSWEGWSEDL